MCKAKLEEEEISFCIKATEKSIKSSNILEKVLKEKKRTLKLGWKNVPVTRMT